MHIWQSVVIFCRYTADLFSLTHGTNSTSCSSSGPAAPQGTGLPEETAAAISQELVVAHEAYHRGDFEASYDAYQQLAEHFTSHEQLPNAQLFYERCLQLAIEHDRADGQAAAHTNLGRFKQSYPSAHEQTS